MRLHHRAAHWVEQHPHLANAAQVSLLAFAGLGIGAVDTVTVVSGLACALPVYLRSRWPVPAALLTGGLLLLCVLVLNVWAAQTGIWAVPLTVHAVALRASRRQRATVLVLALTVAVVVAALHPRWWDPVGTYATDPAEWVVATGLLSLGMGLVVVVSYLLGDLKRVKRQREEALVERARRLEVERDQEVRLAAQDERARIAREMHDVVAHSLSVVIAQADGARYAAAADPAAATATLERISHTGRESLAEMRRLLGVLRTDEHTQHAPVPGLPDLPGLVEGVRRTGLPVALRVEEGPGWARHGGGAVPVPAQRLDEVLRTWHAQLGGGVSLAVFRCVQEALTNVVKHAPGAGTVGAALLRTPTGTAVEVVNDGLPASRNAPLVSSPGHGLRGLHERLGLYGGELASGPDPDDPDRWVLRAWLPVPASLPAGPGGSVRPGTATAPLPAPSSAAPSSVQHRPGPHRIVPSTRPREDAPK